jgi:hypothetical protein
VRFPAAEQDVTFVRTLRSRSGAWVWLIALSLVFGAAAIVSACTDHNRCSESDPACIFHSYTLLHTAGPAVLGFVGAPVLISLVTAMLLLVKVARRSGRAGRGALSFAVLSCFIGFVGLVTEEPFMLIAGAFTVCAVAAAPLPPDTNDPLLRSGGTLHGSGAINDPPV